MANYPQQTSVGGKWAKASEIENGTLAQIKSETNPQPSSFTDKNGNPKTQDVCKVLFEGESEPLNVSLNRATLNALSRAFGEDSAEWIDQPLVSETEKVKVAGKTVHALYLIPKGFKKIDDENGFTVILPEAEAIGKTL